MTFEYDSVRQRLIDSLKSKASWAEILFFSTNSRLVDSVSEAISEFASYDEFLTRNTRWDLATEKSALTSQAQFMQYEPHRKIGSTGLLRVSADEGFDAPHTDNISFPKYTVFSDATGEIKFSSTITQSLLSTDNYTDVEVIQGEPKTFNYVANGDEYEEISIVNALIENSLYEVSVNGTTWDEVPDLNAVESTAQVFRLENKLNFDGINLIFGNDIFGVKLQAGDAVTFKYIDTLGISGNILGTGLVTTVESTIYDVNSDAIDIFCTNLSNLDGGSDEEDIEDIRTNGINTFQAGDKAVVKKDYEVRLEQSPYVFKSTVWGAYEYNLDNNVDLWTYVPTEENFVHVSAFTPLGEQLSEAQQIEVITDIQEDKPPTDIVNFIDTDFIYLAFHIQAFIADPAKVLSIVKSEIIDGVTERYSLTNMDFKQPMYEVDWKGYVKSIDGVEYHTSSLDLVYYSVFNESYLGDINFDIYSIDKETIQVYIKNTTIVDDPYILIGIDDGLGNFIAQPGYDLTGSSINYTTGAGVLNVVSGLTDTFGSYQIKTYYKNDSVNIELKTRNQIFKVAEVTDVTTEYIV